METYPVDETAEIDAERFIALSFERVWPKYVVTWSIRRREGEGDFPLATGTVESLPTRDEPIDEMWNRLRDAALAAAANAAGPVNSLPESKRGLWGRLFGR